MASRCQLPAFRLWWDVFLSFRGEYTGTERLYTELEANGIRAFRDNDGLTQGDSLDPTLFNAIEDSAASIAIISPKYASSRWCLEELARICECRRLILPVFYRVDPSDVRRQKGPFQDHFRSHEEKFEKELVLRWRKAMKTVGGISGWVFQDREPQLIKILVKRVLTELSNTPMFVAPYVVGVDSRLDKLRRLLDVNSKGILVLGLHGMGGVGETTLAKALYNKLVGHFTHRSFISNVGETSAKQSGLVTVQNMLIADLAPGEKPVFDERDGKIAIKRILGGKRVLVVLDDIDDASQLNGLAARRGWFDEGSLVIISTRDRELLLPDLVSEIYEVKELDLSDSLKLFSYHALRREKPTEAFLNLSNQIVLLTGGLPLALEVFGSLLFDKRKVKEWKDALQKLKQSRPGNLQDVLKISFDGLDEQEKCIFLDITCLLLNLKMKRDGAIDVMKGCGFSAESALDVLQARSLIKITEDNTLWMHDQIREMGRQLIQQENPVDPGMRSRLWNHSDIQSVLQDGKGTRNIQGITLDIEKNRQKVMSAKTIAWYKLRSTPTVASALRYLKEMYRDYFEHNEGEIILFTKSFEVMVNLRLLQLSNVRLEGTFKHLPAELKWLQWRKCPLKYLPLGCPRELTVLDLSESKIEKVWGCRWWCWYNRKDS